MILDGANKFNKTAEGLYNLLTVNVLDTSTDLKGKFTFNSYVKVDWGDGTSTEYEKGRCTVYHDYSSYSSTVNANFYADKKDAITAIEVTGNNYTSYNSWLLKMKEGLTSIKFADDDYVFFATDDLDYAGTRYAPYASRDLVTIDVDTTSYCGDNLAELPLSNITYFKLTNDIIASKCVTWFVFLSNEDIFNSNLTYFELGTATASFQSADVDGTLLLLDNSGVSNATITFGGSTGARTSDSDTAVSNLTGRGCIVTTN